MFFDKSLFRLFTTGQDWQARQDWEREQRARNERKTGPMPSYDFSKMDVWDKLANLFIRVGEYASYTVYILYYTLTSANVPISKKLMISGAMAYMVLPSDWIPDFMPVVKYADDFAAFAAIYFLVKDAVTPEIRQAAALRCCELFEDFDWYQAEEDLNGRG